MKKIRVGIVGYGRIAMTHADAWRNTPDAELVAAADSSGEARRKASEAGLQVYESVEEMIAGAKVDAISVCTPPSTHLKISVAALERGVSVLCEKPSTVDAPTTERLMEVVRKSRAVFQMATKFRHVPEIRTARELIANGDIGDVMHFQIEFAGKADMSQRWNSNPALSGGGVIIDNGSHALDLVEFLFGSPASVHTHQLSPSNLLYVEDNARLDVNTTGGTRGEIILSWKAQPASDFYITVHGTQGTIAIGWKASFFSWINAAPVQIGSGYDKNRAHVSMTSAFRNMMRGVASGWITPEECLVNSASIDASYRSLVMGGRSTVEDFGLAAKAA